jgi:hypothetical protein
VTWADEGGIASNKSKKRKKDGDHTSGSETASKENHQGKEVE